MYFNLKLKVKGQLEIFFVVNSQATVYLFDVFGQGQHKFLAKRSVITISMQSKIFSKHFNQIRVHSNRECHPLVRKTEDLMRIKYTELS